MFRSASWRLKVLEVQNRLSPLPFVAMTRGDPCAGLQMLYLGGCDLDFAALASARFWPTLERLILLHPTITQERAEALARCQEAPRLRVLTAYRADLDAQGMRHLAGSPLCAALDALDLASSPLGPPGAVELTRMPAAPRRLDLGGCYIGDEGLAALAAWPGLARCRVLNLAFNGITQEGVAALARSPHSAGLVGVNLYVNFIGDEGLERLLAADWAGRLEALNVNSCRLTMRSTKALLAADLGALRELQVDHDGRRILRKKLSHVPYVG
jgi:hypothetical protein